MIETENVSTPVLRDGKNLPVRIEIDDKNRVTIRQSTSRIHMSEELYDAVVKTIDDILDQDNGMAAGVYRRAQPSRVRVSE